MSKVSVPTKGPEESELEDELKTREVRSMVQVRPRVIPSGTPQPNKNLLLKAVAEAQRSVAQTPHVGSLIKVFFYYMEFFRMLFNSLFNFQSNSLSIEIARDNEKHVEEVPLMRKFSQKEKIKLKNLLLSHATQDKINSSEDDGKAEEEYIPKPIMKTPKETPNYIPSSTLSELSDGKINSFPHFSEICSCKGCFGRQLVVTIDL